MLALSYIYRNRDAHVLASAHRDGELMGQTIRRLGYGHVRGSSTRGGTKAILDMVEKLQSGFDVAFAVDGPRGPRFQAKPGPIQIAKMSGAAILPVTAGSRWKKQLNSWDAFQVAYPFTEVRVDYAEPIVVPPDADPETIEKKRLELESKLNAITKSNDDILEQ
jgi:lysophospholipid acyltransferase (LPLAT)-like uncharacterized protein